MVPRPPHIKLDIDDDNPDRRGLAALEITLPTLFGDALRIKTHRVSKNAAPGDYM
jgi:hypothetical protein